MGSPNPISKIDAVRALYGRDSYDICDGNGVVTWKDGHETTAAETTAIDAKYILKYQQSMIHRNMLATEEKNIQIGVLSLTRFMMTD